MTAIPVFSWQLYEEASTFRRAEIDGLIANITNLWGDPRDWLPIDILPQSSASQLFAQGLKPQNWSLQYLRKLCNLAQTSRGQLDLVHSCMFSVVWDRYKAEGPFSDISRYPHLMAEDMDLVERQVELLLNTDPTDTRTKPSSAASDNASNQLDKSSAAPQAQQASAAPKSRTTEQTGQQQQQREKQELDSTTKSAEAEKTTAKPKRSEDDDKQRCITAISKDWPSGDWVPRSLLPHRKGKRHEEEEDPSNWNLTLLKALRTLSSRTRKNVDLAHLYMLRQVTEKHNGKTRPLISADLGKVYEMEPILKQLTDELNRESVQDVKKSNDLLTTHDTQPHGGSQVDTAINNQSTIVNADPVDGQNEEDGDTAPPSNPLRKEKRSGEVELRKDQSATKDSTARTHPNSASRQAESSSITPTNSPKSAIQIPSEDKDGHRPYGLLDSEDELFVPETTPLQRTEPNVSPASNDPPGYAAEFVDSHLATRTVSPDVAPHTRDRPSPRLFKELVRLPGDDDTEMNLESMVSDHNDPDPQQSRAAKRSAEAMKHSDHDSQLYTNPKKRRVHNEQATSSNVDHRMVNNNDHHPPQTSRILPRRPEGSPCESKAPSPTFRSVAIGRERQSSNRQRSGSRDQSHDAYEGHRRMNSLLRTSREERISQTQTRVDHYHTPRWTPSLPDCHCQPFETLDDDHYCAVADSRQTEKANYEEMLVEKDLQIQELEAKSARLESQLRGKERMITELKRTSGRD